MHQLLAAVASDHLNLKAGLDSWGGFQASTWWTLDMRVGVVLGLVVTAELFLGLELRPVAPGLEQQQAALM